MKTLNIGDSAELVKHVSEDEILSVAKLSGDYNPIHVDKEYAKRIGLPSTVVHAIWSGLTISALLGTKLPGPGTIILNQHSSYLYPIYQGDIIRFVITVKSKNNQKSTAIIACSCINQSGVTVVSSEVEVFFKS